MQQIAAENQARAAQQSDADAERNQCINNLRQWGAAYELYADDNEDYLPRRGQGVQALFEIDRPSDWFNALPLYFALPSSSRTASAPESPSMSRNCARMSRCTMSGRMNSPATQMKIKKLEDSIGKSEEVTKTV